MPGIFFYNIAIYCYGLAIRLAAPFNNRARLWVDGRKNEPNWNKLSLKSGKRIWFHCASLGEFEQARPLIERLRNERKEDAIILTFFSPSGFEIRKNYEGADLVAYLPLDTPENARNFIAQLKPDLVFFVKYEFWFNYLNQLKNQNIPVILFSAVFRPNQIFFKWYGGIFRQMLKTFSHIFVQNKDSKVLLENIGIKAAVANDTRFDRVYQIAQSRKSFPLVESFKGNTKIFIAGSTWQKDEELIIKLINENVLPDYKFIIAPHNINPARIDEIINELKPGAVRFSALSSENAITARIIVVDNIGNLASLYSYADMAYIGGGFNTSVHNILEATINNIPVLFGPNHQKSEEAKELLALQLAFTISDYDGLNEKIRYAVSHLVTDSLYKLKVKDYMQAHLGGSDTVLKTANTYL